MQAHMLRISVEESSAQNTTLQREGHLVGPWVEELRLSCDKVLGESKRLTLDLSAVSFVDRDGITLLRGLKTREVVVSKCSAFLADQLKDERASFDLL
jgi:anti-anti-sigma regulatory factor